MNASSRKLSMGSFFVVFSLLCAPWGSAATAERKDECRDRICQSDSLPSYDHKKYAIFKKNNLWLLIPKEYGNPNLRSFGFYWPSKEPFGSSSAPPQKVGSSFASTAIEIFLRSIDIPTSPSDYGFLLFAESKGWVATKKTLRLGLEQWVLKKEIGVERNHVTYYVATHLKGADGQPPVAACNHNDSRNRGGTAFYWHEGIWLSTRWNQRYCAEWPEIYQEIIKVLATIQKA